MTDNARENPWDANEQTLLQTQERRAELRANFEKKDEELRILEEKLVNIIEAQKDLQVSIERLMKSTDVVRSLIMAPTEPAPAPKLDDRFYGKPLPECAAIIIREAGRALTEEEILTGLRAGGVQIVSKQPLLNVKRSMGRRPDILYTRNRKWAVIETPIDGEKLPKGRAVNNFSEAHAESTRIGIEAAKARGVAWGRSATITPEKEKVIAELRSLGMQAKEIIEAIGVSRTTYFNYLKEHGLSKKYEFNNSDNENN